MDRAASGWAVRRELDPTASQLEWSGAAMIMDEPELAARILAGPAVGGNPEAEHVRRGALAEALVVLGRPAEARALLEHDGVRPPGPGEGWSWRQMVLAAAYATGDASAWAWFQERLRDVGEGAARTRLTRVAAAVAEARGDRPAAARAWASLRTQVSTATSVRMAARAAQALVETRQREGTPQSIADVLVDAVATVRRFDPERAAVRAALRQVTDGLLAVGDRAGARLVLALAVAETGRDRDLRRDLRALRPRRGPWRTLLVALALVVIAAAGAAVVVADVQHRAGAGAGAPRLLAMLILVGVATATGRFVRVPGMTASETRVWWGLRELRYDSVEDRAALPRSGGWTGAAAIGGAVATFVAIAAALAGPDGTWPAWSTTGVAFALWAVLTCLGAVAAAMGLRWARHAAARRRLARARAESLARAEQRAATCECTALWCRWGPSAEAYARRHLTRPVPAVAVPLTGSFPGAEVLTCPQTGLPWLVGPLGGAGALVALAGCLRDVVPAAPVDRPGDPSVGYYL